jgi:hypothetical protein
MLTKNGDKNSNNSSDSSCGYRLKTRQKGSKKA